MTVAGFRHFRQTASDSHTTLNQPREGNLSGRIGSLHIYHKRALKVSTESLAQPDTLNLNYPCK